MLNNLLKVRIISPQQVIFEGEAISVSSINSAGKFDILLHHANFITLIEDSPILIRKADKKLVEFKLPLAIIYTLNNKVTIYTKISLELKQTL